MGINKTLDLNTMEMVHIFEYYDFPLFFISKNSQEELYLNYFVEEVNEKIDKWLFCRISHKERRELIEQRMPVLKLLHKLLEGDRLNYLYVKLNSENSTFDQKFELVTPENFDAESFPEEEFFVDYDFVTNTQLIKIEKELVDSTKFKVVLKDTENKHDVSLDFLMNVLDGLKKSINGIANDLNSKQFGTFSSTFLNLRVDSVEPSSFGLWLRTDPLDYDIFEIQEKSLSNLFSLINDLENKNRLEIVEQVEIDEDYSIETIKNVKKLLKNIQENQYSFKLEAITKQTGEQQVVKFDNNSYDKIEILNDILRKNNKKYTEIMELRGVLTSVNTVNNYFQISTLEYNIRGTLSKELFQNLKINPEIKFSVPSEISAIIEKQVNNDHSEDTYSEKYILLSFEQSDQNDLTDNQ